MNHERRLIGNGLPTSGNAYHYERPLIAAPELNLFLNIGYSPLD